jgi:hypothetical protein
MVRSSFTLGCSRDRIGRISRSTTMTVPAHKTPNAGCDGYPVRYPGIALFNTTNIYFSESSGQLTPPPVDKSDYKNL